MLYIFQSRDCADIIMLEPNGRRLLEIIGKEAAAKGIITPQQMPEAVLAMRQAIDAEEQALRDARRPGIQLPSQDSAGAPGVTLKQRLLPMIEMMGRCAKAQRDITWGV
jgi:hypothetical protein